VALTEYEQRQLQLLADQLLNDDPRLAAKLGAESFLPPSSARTSAGAFTMLVGLFVFATALAARIPTLGVLGLILMCTGVYLISLGFHLPRERCGDGPAPGG
jgi:uncharacterized membrane protein HdeD (DUF308 family)